MQGSHELNEFILTGFRGMSDLGGLGAALSFMGAFMCLSLMQVVARHANLYTTRGLIQYGQRIGLALLACSLMLDVYGYLGAQSRPWMSHIFIVGSLDIVLMLACIRHRTHEERQRA